MGSKQIIPVPPVATWPNKPSEHGLSGKRLRRQHQDRDHACVGHQTAAEVAVPVGVALAPAADHVLAVLKEAGAQAAFAPAAHQTGLPNVQHQRLEQHVHRRQQRWKRQSLNRVIVPTQPQDGMERRRTLTEQRGRRLAKCCSRRRSRARCRRRRPTEWAATPPIMTLCVATERRM